MPTRAPSSPNQRGSPASHASRSEPPAIRATFCPETASSVAILTITMREVDGYVRVSRVGGREGDSFISPALQREQIEAYAKAHGLTIARWHEDLDKSGG